VERHGSPARAYEAAAGAPAAPGAAAKAPLDDAQRSAVRRLAEAGAGTYLGAHDYPRLLALTPEPPPYLFREGPLWPLRGPAVAVVGPRACTAEAAAFARTLCAALARLGVLVVSGGAAGVDAAAHAGALDAGGAAVLVAATGIDRVYPPGGRALRQRIALVGCVLTELLPGAPPRRDFFPTRNRVLVGLCDAAVVVEGRERSGTAWSARHALGLGRPLFAWTGSAAPALRALPDLLARRGAVPIEEPDPALIVAAIAAQRD
jgi:DNA processing protein